MLVGRLGVLLPLLFLLPLLVLLLWLVLLSFGKGQTGSAPMGSLQVLCFLTEGLFGYSRGNPLTCVAPCSMLRATSGDKCFWKPLFSEWLTFCSLRLRRRSHDGNQLSSKQHAASKWAVSSMQSATEVHAKMRHSWPWRVIPASMNKTLLLREPLPSNSTQTTAPRPLIRCSEI